MISPARLAIVVLLLSAAVACSVGYPRGGEPETQLTAATQAQDVAKVKQLLSSGADPNKVVDVAGNPQSAWYLALHQIRASKPATVEIALAMLGAGAKANSAWGTQGGRPAKSFMERLGSARNAGTYNDNPLEIAMGNPVPSVIKAIIDKGFDPKYGTSVLVDAVEADQAEIVRLLVEKGVDPNHATQYGSPLGAAIATRNVALMTYLEEHGATEKGR